MSIVVRDIIWISPPPGPTMREIAHTVASRHRMTLELLRTDTRAHWISHVRQEAMWEMYETGRYSNQQIASFFGLTDHTSTIHGRKAHAARLVEREGKAA